MRRGRRVDPAADRPVYKQVADDLRDQINTGDLVPGEGLPGEARLADEYSVGVNSIRNALDILRGEGWIVTEKGVGSRVRAREERSVVDLPPGARVTVRPATEEERRRFGLSDREPVAQIDEPDGAMLVLPAYKVVFQAPPA